MADASALSNRLLLIGMLVDSIGRADCRVVVDNSGSAKRNATSKRGSKSLSVSCTSQEYPSSKSKFTSRLEAGHQSSTGCTFVISVLRVLQE
jgi:hypothetical protein